jgi:hypothetical protein
VDQSDEEIQQSLDYLALLIQTHLDLRAFLWQCNNVRRGRQRKTNLTPQQQST